MIKAFIIISSQLERNIYFAKKRVIYSEYIQAPYPSDKSLEVLELISLFIPEFSYILEAEKYQDIKIKDFPLFSKIKENSVAILKNVQNLFKKILERHL